MMTNKKIIYGILVIVLVIVGTGLFLLNKPTTPQPLDVISTPPVYDITSMSCDELIEISGVERNKLNFDCKKDSDCIYGESGWCGSCVNKDTSTENLKNLFNIYNIGVEKDCFPQLECMPFTCQCVNNECISQTAVRVIDKLLTKDKEICSPSPDDGTPYCNQLFARDFVNNPKYAIIVHKLCPGTNETPEEIIIYNTLNDLIPPSGKARSAHYCPSLNQFWVYDYDSEKIPMHYWYGPFDGYPASW